jgi:hypothetical protein
MDVLMNYYIANINFLLLKSKLFCSLSPCVSLLRLRISGMNRLSCVKLCAVCSPQHLSSTLENQAVFRFVLEL